MPIQKRCLSLLPLLTSMFLTAAGPAVAEPEPVRIPMQYEPASLDPHKLEGLEEYRIALDLFEGLTTYSAEDAVIPGMATSWETSNDGLTWTFHLRDASWSDGSPLTAEDFVYSFRRVLDPATACPYTLALMPILNAQAISTGHEKDLSKLGVVAIDAHTLRITLAQPTPWFLMLLTGQTSMPVPRQAIEKWGDQWTRPEHMVSNGAFALKKWVPLGEVDLARNARFHDAASVKIEAVDYILADDTKAALKRYEAGELDVANVLGQDLPRVQRERPNELHTYAQLRSTFFVINMGGPLGADPRVRRALAMVIDRDILENQVVRRGQVPAYSLVPGMSDYTVQRPDWADLSMVERIAAAKKLLAEANVARPLKLKILSPKQDLTQLYTRAIIEMWHTALGIEAEEEAVEPRVYFGRAEHHDFEIAFGAWSADYTDAWTFLANFRRDAAELNPGNYSNSNFDALLDRSRNAPSAAERSALLQSAENLMLEDQPILPIDYTVSQLLVSPRLHGYGNAPLNCRPSRFLFVTETQ
jgi:oligopeptide transport system substrate-binding protein